MADRLKPGAVLFAKDVARVAAFYQAVVPMAETHAEAGLRVLESADQQLVIHGIPPRIANTIVIADPPVAREDVALKLIFAVASIDAVREQIENAGGQPLPRRAFTARGFRAWDGSDPEGNVVQFREPA